ncbi:MAG TPA: hypothetical protein VIP11_16190 [Gemmatimonadaceae bacterium]
MRRVLFGFILPLLGAVYSASAQPAGVTAITRLRPPGESDQLHMAIIRYFLAGSSKDTTDYSTSTTDLDGDGIDDAVVLVRGVSWCVYGSGCTLLVFQGTKSGFRFVSKTILSEGPVLVSPVKANGWKSLIVWNPPAFDRLLRFDGQGYPASASGQLPVTTAQLNAAALLIEARKVRR